MAGRHVQRGRGPKRLSSWFQFQPIVATLTAVGGTVLYTLNAAALALRPFTIVRTRFKYMVISDQAAAIENQVGAVGMAVVSDQASAVGVTAVPTPITDMASDLWFQHEIFMGNYSSLTDRSFGAPGPREIDSKAMRKVDIGQDIVVVSEFDSTTSGGFQIFIAGRMLVKVN